MLYDELKNRDFTLLEKKDADSLDIKFNKDKDTQIYYKTITADVRYKDVKTGEEAFSTIISFGCFLFIKNDIVIDGFIENTDNIRIRNIEDEVHIAEILDMLNEDIVYFCGESHERTSEA